MRYPFAICVSHYFQWANCSFETCFYTLQPLVSVNEVLFHLGTAFEDWKQIALDEVISLAHILKVFCVLFLFFNLLHTFRLVQTIWVDILDLPASFLLDAIKSILLALAEDCQWSGPFLLERKAEGCAQGRFSFPQVRETWSAS